MTGRQENTIRERVLELAEQIRAEKIENMLPTGKLTRRETKS